MIEPRRIVRMRSLFLCLLEDISLIFLNIVVFWDALFFVDDNFLLNFA